MLSVEEKAAAVLVLTGVIAPIIGVALRRQVAEWGPYGCWSYAALTGWGARGAAAPARLDPAMQAAEVRQMLIAKAERQRRRGEAALDVEVEAERLLTAPSPRPQSELDIRLRSEIRQLVVTRNARRARQGLEPFDVAAETERQLTDLS